MANHKTPEIGSLSFSDFPEDIQVCILSFLSPTEIANFACTSKRYVSLCRNDTKLWYTMCNRRWGTKTQINKWGSGNITYKLLYRTLNEWDNLIGFWRRCGDPIISSPPLIYFEWGPSFLTASRVSPSSQNGSYHVTKSPFLFMGISPNGEILNYLDVDGHSEILGGFVVNFSQLVGLQKDLISVNVNFMGNDYVIVEENRNFVFNDNCQRNGITRSSSSNNLRGGEESEDVIGGTAGSLPDRLVSEMYIQMANRTSPGADKRRQRRKEKERQWRRKWETEHFVKIVNCSPTPSRPLQGLWKGICGDMYLDFYLVAYDEIGGIICRRVGDLLSCSAAPVFWTSNATFIESPFPPEEEYIYDGRVHLQPPAAENLIYGQHPLTDIEAVSRILLITSSYELVITGLAGTSVNPRLGEGRIWQYVNGTFGFGFLRDNFIIDLKCITQDGCLLDIMELSNE